MSKPLAYPDLGISFNLASTQIKLDLRNLLEFYFIEDIFSFLISGKIRFIDRQGILESGPFTGTETMDVIYGAENQMAMRVQFYKMDIYPLPAPAQDEKMFVIDLVFIDSAFSNLLQKQFSKSWKDVKYSEVVKDICKHMVGITKFNKFEDTKEKCDGEENPPYIMNYVTPAMVISDISSRCKNTNDNYGFLFFQNTDGYNFITLESLLSKGEEGEGGNTNNNYVLRTTKGYFDSTNILGWKINGIDMSMMKLLRGGVRTGFDPKKKERLNEKSTYKKGTEKITVLGGKTLYPDVSDEDMNISPAGDINKEIIKNRYFNEFMKNYNMQQIAEIIVQGHENRTCGELIDIQWPSYSKDEVYNKGYSGNFLIKSITHYFCLSTMPVYRQKMICIKNGYHELQDSNLLSASKQNKGYVIEFGIED